MDICDKHKKLPVFREFPELEEKLPYVHLSTLPTPVEKMGETAEELGIEKLFIKRDDLSGEIYGGNKVRKLEFLLSEILQTNAKEVITFGFAGSNHALATAIYAKKIGLKSTSMLMEQVNAHYVRKNLLASHFYKARLCHYKNLATLSCAFAGELFRSKKENGVFPKIIPAGGTCPLGILGYVNAAFELKDQIDAGEINEPDLIYLPLGSMGTSIGLMIGLKVLGLKTEVIPVRVIEERMASPGKMLKLIKATVKLIRKHTPSFPELIITRDELNIRNEFLGEGYAWFTEKAVNAAQLMKSKKGIEMNGAYSAKAFSALVEDAHKGKLKDKTVLFWNTYNSRDLSAITNKIDYHQLPRKFHRYFDSDVQELDKQ